MIKDKFTDWLINNKGYILEICEPLIKQMDEHLSNEEAVFHEDIISQFENIARGYISVAAGKALACSPADIMEILEELDLEELLNE